MYVCVCVVVVKEGYFLKLQLLAANHGKLIRVVSVCLSTIKMTSAILFNFISSEICFPLFRFHLMLDVSMLLCIPFFFFWFLDQYYALFICFLKFNQYRLNLITIRVVKKENTEMQNVVVFECLFI